MHNKDAGPLLKRGTKERVERHRLSRIVQVYGLLIVLSLIWGIAFVAIKVLEPMLSPVNLTLLRWFIASGAFLVLLPIFGRPKQPLVMRDVPRLLLVSFATVVAYHMTLNASEGHISAGFATLLVSLGPIFIVILSSILLSERQERTVYLAVILAFCGALVLFFGSLRTGGVGTLWGSIEAVGTALSYAIFAVFSKPLVQKVGARSFTIWVGLIGTAMLLPFISGSFVHQVETLPLSGWMAISYLSLLSTVFGYMLFYTMIGRGAVSRVSIQLYLVPVVGVAGGALLLDETVSIFTLIGGGAMIAAVGLATRKSNGNRKKEKQLA